MLKKILRAARFVTFALLLIFIGCEVYFRWMFSEHVVLMKYPLVYAPDTAQGYRGIPHIEGYIRFPSISKHFRLNNFGFYGHDFKKDHPDSIFRILVGGSSVVEGIWANQKTDFPTMLDSMFKAKGYKVEVINVSISGINRNWQDMQLLRQLVPKFHANLALFERPFPIHRLDYYRETYRGYSLLYTGDNDVERRLSLSIAKEKTDWLWANPIVTGIFDLSYCLREWEHQPHPGSWNSILDRWGDYKNNNPASLQYYYSFQAMTVRESIYWLNDIEAEMNKEGCELVAFEYGNNEMSDRIRASDEVKFPYLSLSLPMDGPEYHHELDWHFNQIGFDLITTKLFDLLSHDYIPEKFRPRMIKPQTLN